MPKNSTTVILRMEDALHEKVLNYATEKTEGNASLAIRNILRRFFHLKEGK